MKRWYAAIAALLASASTGAAAAQDLPGAARELARKTAAFVGRGEPVSVRWRDVSVIGSADLAMARTAFESELRDRGGRIGDIAPTAEAQITYAENSSQDLLIEEIRKGEERQVWIVSWKAPGAAHPDHVLTLEKRVLWETAEPLLDVLVTTDVLVALTAARIVWLTNQNGQWSPAGSAELPVRVSVRDPRGRIRPSGGGFLAAVPGMQCRGGLVPQPAIECKASEEPWLLESGSRAMLLATLSPERNFFDGRVVMQNGVRKTITPFYSAASVEREGKPVWLLTGLDGRTVIADSALEPSGSIASWGSDIAGISARCAGGFQILATRPGDAAESDAVQAFAISGRGAAPLGPAVDFPGPIRALWPAADTAAIAVAQDGTTGIYAAYLVTAACGL